MPVVLGCKVLGCRIVQLNTGKSELEGEAQPRYSAGVFMDGQVVHSSVLGCRALQCLSDLLGSLILVSR